MDMVRFSSIQDPGYQAVSGEIRRWLKGIRDRRDSGRLPEVVRSPSANELTPQPFNNRIEQAKPAIYEPMDSHSYSRPNNQTLDDIFSEPAYRSELAQSYPHHYSNNQIQNHISNQPMYHNPYTHSGNPIQNFNTHEPSYSQPRTHPREHYQHYTSFEPPHSYSGGYPNGQYQSQAPYEPAFRDNRTYSNAPPHNASPRPRFEERGQGSVYQESSHFAETDNKGGKMLQGNYNVTGNISL
ncbi:hypothetical protein N0V86_007528 [Didymella sp. IMI 355093]|nr:hypothetical protein N0V86_007528 [Didymella sp. IMI 355093]